MYKEVHRNKLHFSPPANWMNDPNGMVYYEGEYHLFYQYYPEDIVWGPMHWGHAVSKNLIHWENLPIALKPDSLGQIFSGSAVVDWKNTSGLGSVEQPPMVAIFTHHDMAREKAGALDCEVQSIAYSVDKGRTWEKYAQNPVLSNVKKIKDFRDPKVIWDDARRHWVMVLAAKDRLLFYTSTNLTAWAFGSEWGHEYGDRKGVWECPDLFPLKVEDTDEVKWVLILSLNPGGPNGGSGTQYFIGDFDGNSFTIDPNFEKEILDGKGVWIDHGPDNYAGVTWSDIPVKDARRIFIGWMSNWDYAQDVPTETWRSAMTLPRKLSLHRGDLSYRLTSSIISEISNICDAPTDSITTGIFEENTVLFDNMNSGLFRMQFSAKKDKEGTFALLFSNDVDDKLVLGFDGTTNNYFIDRSKSGKVDFKESFPAMIFAPIDYIEEEIKFDIVIDHGAIEVLADDGKCVLTCIFFATKPFTVCKLIAGNKPVEITGGNVRALTSIW